MLKPFFAALVAGSLTFAIVVGCTTPSTTGTTVNRNKSGDDDDTTPAKKPATTTSHADCTSLPKADPRAACDQCARTKCCDEYAACEGSADCKALKACIDPCASDDLVCILGCQGAHESGGELGGNFGSCLQTSCATECPDNSPKSDSGTTDPFGDGG